MSNLKPCLHTLTMAYTMASINQGGRAATKTQSVIGFCNAVRHGIQQNASSSRFMDTVACLFTILAVLLNFGIMVSSSHGGIATEVWRAMVARMTILGLLLLASILYLLAPHFAPTSYLQRRSMLAGAVRALTYASAIVMGRDVEPFGRLAMYSSQSLTPILMSARFPTHAGMLALTHVVSVLWGQPLSTHDALINMVSLSVMFILDVSSLSLFAQRGKKIFAQKVN